MDLTKFKSFRVMATRIQHITLDREGREVAHMEYTSPPHASSWTIEGIISFDEIKKEAAEVEAVCECADQFLAYKIAELLIQELGYLEDDAYRSALSKSLGRKL